MFFKSEPKQPSGRQQNIILWSMLIEGKNDLNLLIQFAYQWHVVMFIRSTMVISVDWHWGRNTFCLLLSNDERPLDNLSSYMEFLREDIWLSGANNTFWGDQRWDLLLFFFLICSHEYTFPHDNGIFVAVCCLRLYLNKLTFAFWVIML